MKIQNGGEFNCTMTYEEARIIHMALGYAMYRSNSSIEESTAMNGIRMELNSVFHFERNQQNG